MSMNPDRDHLLGDLHNREDETMLCDDLESTQLAKQRQPWFNRRIAVLTLIIVISNWCAMFFFTSQTCSRMSADTSSQHPVPLVDDEDSAVVDIYPILSPLPTEYTRFKWWTPWGLEAGAANQTNLPSAHVSDELWNSVLPSHGLIAVDREWAKERRWPDSMYLPKDEEHGKEKGVYLLEGYHMLHCLTIVRKSFIEAHRGQSLTWPVGHVTHCFDALRQSIQCHADNTPLYTFGDSTAGDGQLRKCKSWDALRKFATVNSACYRDSVETIPLRDHFGFCDGTQPYQGGQDGLP